MNMVGPNPLEMMLLVLLGGGYGLSPGVTPGPIDPLTQKVAPAECLLYVAWAEAGTSAAANSNHTEQLMAEPEIQKFLDHSQNIFLDMIRTAPGQRPEAAAQMEEVSKLIEIVQGRPGALYISELLIDAQANRPPTIKGGGLLRVDGDGPELKRMLDGLQAQATEAQITPIQVAGRPFTRILIDEDAPPITWGIVGNYFAIGIGDGEIELLMQRARGEAPSWLESLNANLAVPRPAWQMYANVNRFVQMVAQQSGSPDAERVVSLLGLDTLQTFATVGGLDESGCVTRSKLTMDGPGTGLMAWVDAAPLAAGDLQLVAADAPVAVAFRLDPSRVLDLWMGLADQIEPRAAEEMRQGMAMFEQQVGVRIRDDLLNALGDTWRVFVQPGPMWVTSGWSVAVQVRDPQRLRQSHDRLLQMAKGGLQQAGPDAPSLTSSTAGQLTIHTLDFRQPAVPVRPSWTVTDKELLIAMTPDQLQVLINAGNAQSIVTQPQLRPLFDGSSRTLAVAFVDAAEVMKAVMPLAQMGLQVLARGPGAPPLDTANLPSADVFYRHLQPSVLSLGRTADGVEFVSRQTLPGGNIGASAPVAVALLLPAVQAAREAARRAQSMNNLKQIALAMHNFHDTYRQFPAGYSADANDKPLLSWRVHVLPFIENVQLYEQFRLDEPWDSEHNKQLIAKIPEVYRSPNSKLPAEQGMANYLGVGGADGVFVRPRPSDRLGSSIARIRDGTSNTLMAVEVPDERAVEWTRPADFSPDKQNPLNGLLGMRPGGFLGAMADGSVRFISEAVDVGVLNALFTKSGAEAVSLP